MGPEHRATTAGLLLLITLIAFVYTDRERPVVYAANPATWVLPGLVVLVLVGVALLVPVTRRIGRGEPGRMVSGPAALVPRRGGRADLGRAAPFGVTSALVIGYGGVHLAVLASAGAPGQAVGVLAGTLAASAVLGAVLAGRWSP